MVRGSSAEGGCLAVIDMHSGEPAAARCHLTPETKENWAKTSVVVALVGLLILLPLSRVLAGGTKR